MRVEKYTLLSPPRIVFGGSSCHNDLVIFAVYYKEHKTAKRLISNFRYQPTVDTICSAFERKQLINYNDLQSIDLELHIRK